MAYSLFLFMRDVADDDFVGWIDRQLAAVKSESVDRLPALHEAIIGPLRNVYGVADKVRLSAPPAAELARDRRRRSGGREPGPGRGLVRGNRRRGKRRHAHDTLA
jgi:hypothetical protein